MLSVRLRPHLHCHLEHYCAGTGLSKSAVVKIALEEYLASNAELEETLDLDPLLSQIGTGNRTLTTDEIMRMTRGSNWNQRANSTPRMSKP